ncbi:crossover junction endodeoxyribonuclease RuvC [Patescibacteria group bacterium]|nr:crossover junction endodeoxyribonuclease RuvC [Patescibacteria group bacterium]
MRILGIDPGLATVGFAILDYFEEEKNLIEYGVITTSAKTPKTHRLKEIHNDISAILGEYKPDICAIEQIFFSKNVTTGIQVSESRGVILLALNEANVPLQEFSPSSLKRSLTGNGNADKQMIQKMVMLELKLQEIPKPDDAADALSLALALCSELRYHQIENKLPT